MLVRLMLHPQGPLVYTSPMKHVEIPGQYAYVVSHPPPDVGDLSLVGELVSSEGSGVGIAMDSVGPDVGNRVIGRRVG